MIFTKLVGMLSILGLAANVMAGNEYVHVSGHASKADIVVTRSENLDGATHPWMGSTTNAGHTVYVFDRSCGDNLGWGCGVGPAVSHVVREGEERCLVSATGTDVSHGYFEAIGHDNSGAYVDGSNEEFGGPKGYKAAGTTLVAGWYDIEPGTKKVIFTFTPRKALGFNNWTPNARHLRLFIACQ